MVSDIRSKTKGEKTKLAQKTLELFAQNSIFWQILQIYQKIFLSKYDHFCLKEGKIVQKLKNFPKTQGENHKTSIFWKIYYPQITENLSQKNPGLDLVTCLPCHNPNRLTSQMLQPTFSGKLST